MTRPAPPEPLSALLSAVLRKHPAFSANPLGDWAAFVGEQVARASTPRSLKNGVLTVIAHDSVWKHHLEMHKEAILARVNSGRAEPVATSIVIRVGTLPESPPDALNPNAALLSKMTPKHLRTPVKKAPLRDLSPEEKALLAALPDPDLRRAGTRILRRLPAGDPPAAS